MKAANITSTDAVRDFVPVVRKFEHEVRDTLEILILEVQRAIDWVEHDRMRYWPRQAKLASDKLNEAYNELQRAQMSLTKEKPAATEQKVKVQKWKQRLRLCEDKVRAVRSWRVTINKEVDEFRGKIGKMSNYIDAETPRMVAALERMAQALAKYTETSGGPKAAGASPISFASILSDLDGEAESGEPESGEPENGEEAAS